MRKQLDTRNLWLEENPQEKHFDVRDLLFDCDTQDPHFLCSLRLTEE
jgi:hypothetical protein